MDVVVLSLFLVVKITIAFEVYCPIKDQVQNLHNYIFMTQKMKQQTELVTLGMHTYFIFVLAIIAYIIDPFVILQV